MGDKVKGLKGNEDLGQNIKVGKTKVHFGENTQSLHSSKDITLPHDTDTFVDHYKYWNDQMKNGKATDGVVTPKNPEMTPNKHGFQVNGTDPLYVSNFAVKNKKDIKLDHDTD